MLLNLVSDIKSSCAGSNAHDSQRPRRPEHVVVVICYWGHLVLEWKQFGEGVAERDTKGAGYLVEKCKLHRNQLMLVPCNEIADQAIASHLSGRLC